MSEINKDKDVIDNGRRNKLKDAEVPLRDQINEALFAKLEEMNIGQKVVTLWNRGSYNRQRWLERQKAYLASWDEHLVSSTEGSFEGSSQLHIPMPFIVCKTLHARFLQALWQDPPFNLKARNEASIERIPTVADTLRYSLMEWANYDKGAEQEIDLWVWRWITNGSGILKMGWDTRYERFVDVVEAPAPGRPQIKLVNGKETVIPTTKMVEKEIKVTKKTFDGPTVRGVQVEDILIVGGNGDPDAAEAVIEQDWLTASDLWTLADRKVFRTDKVEKVISGGPQKKSSSIAGELKVQRNDNAGHSSLDFETDHDRYHVLEAYLQADVDGSGINTNVVVWVHSQSKELLRAAYLRRISPKGERPYAKADFILRDGQEYGVGMPEVLFPLSQEMDAMHNMRIDWGMISVMPFGFYRSSSGLDPETIRFEPGALIPTDNPHQDVYFPNMGNRTVFGMQEEQALQGIVERLSSISDVSLGVPGAQGITRTATGAKALVGEMGANLDVFLRRLNRGWKKCIRYNLHLLQKRCPAGLSFRLTGEDGKDYWRYIRSIDDLQGDYDIEVSPNSSTSNPQAQQETAQQIQQFVNNPLSIQMGTVNQGNYYEAGKNFLQSLGVKDFGKYLTKPPEYARTLTPEEEANRILRGIDVPVVPGMDHDGFIAFFQHIHDNDELAGQFNTQQFLALAKQAKQHEQVAQAMKAAAAQQANAAQMQRNQMATMAPIGGSNSPSMQAYAGDVPDQGGAVAGPGAPAGSPMAQ